IGRPAVIAAMSDAVRYSGKRAGYHGGATDMEMVVPLAVLQKEEEPPNGWNFVDLNPPEWWAWEAAVTGEVSPKRVPKPAHKSPPKPKAETAVLELPFVEEDRLPEAHWIAALMNGTVFAEQKDTLGKSPLKDGH